MSPTYIKKLTPHAVEEVDYSAGSLAEAAQHELDGIYTVSNTYNTFRVLKLDAHLDRMEDSARREGIDLVLDRPRLRQTLRHMIEAANFGDVRFRITAPHDQPQNLVITLEPFTPPASAIINAGVRCVTVPGLLRRNPAAKTNDWIASRGKVTLPEGIYEGLLVDGDGHILEGLTSNFYAVLDGELRTAGEGVLPGIAQQIVFTVAPALMILRRDAVHTDDIPRFTEAFITSSSRGVIPVVEIDDIQIGDGTPGKRTMAIRRAYSKWVEEHLEEL